VKGFHSSPSSTNHFACDSAPSMRTFLMLFSGDAGAWPMSLKTSYSSAVKVLAVAVTRTADSSASSFCCCSLVMGFARALTISPLARATASDATLAIPGDAPPLLSMTFMAAACKAAWALAFACSMFARCAPLPAPFVDVDADEPPENVACIAPLAWGMGKRGGGTAASWGLPGSLLPLSAAISEG